MSVKERKGHRNEEEKRVRTFIVYRRFGGFLPVSVSAAFSDISETAWYAPAVEYVQENGIMNGKGEDRFDPEGEMTRAMFVQVLSIV